MKLESDIYTLIYDDRLISDAGKFTLEKRNSRWSLSFYHLEGNENEYKKNDNMDWITDDSFLAEFAVCKRL